MTQRRVENTRVHFWTYLPVSVKIGPNLERIALFMIFNEKSVNVF